jgi:hypothetical protein
LAHTATQELEFLKQQLQIATNEHSIMLSRLQDRRAVVIGELYAEIARGVSELESYLRPMQLVGEADRPTKAVKARDALMKALASFNEKQIWLTAECAAQVHKLIELCMQTFNRYDLARQSATRARNDSAEERETDAWMKAWDRVTGEGAETRKAAGGRDAQTVRAGPPKFKFAECARGIRRMGRYDKSNAPQTVVKVTTNDKATHAR